MSVTGFSLISVMPVTQTKKYGSKHKDVLVVVHINLTGFPCNNGTFHTRHAAVYISVNLAMEFSISCGNIVFVSQNYTSVYLVGCGLPML